MTEPIAVLGAGGRAGRQIVAEALTRGRPVIAVVRDPRSYAGPRATVVAGDALDPESVATAAKGCAAVVSAVTPFTAPPSSFDGFDTGYYRRVAETLVATGVPRIIVVGLFATLRATPDGPRVLDDPRLFPPSLRPFAQAHADGVAHLRRSGSDWLVLAPPAGLSADAPDTGRYELGDDTVDEKRKDRPVAYEDLARAVLDQIDQPTRHRSLVALYGAH